jgi:beta-lactam-binding protein with PASTA domain
VDLRISAGPDDRIVPGQVVGLTIGDATSLLVGLRLQAVEEPTFDPEAVVGTVLASIPPAGQVVPADSAVTLIVSAGPEPVEMPDIIGLQLDEAIDVIKALGLIFIDTTGTPGEEVIGSVPPIGAVVDVGAEVTIILNDPVDEDEAEDEG